MRPLRSLLPLLGLLPSLAGCGADVAPAEAQWRVIVSSDAPVPQFGNRLLVEVVDEAGAACNGCRRELAAGDPEAWPISFGVVPDGRSRRVRVRLFRDLLASPAGPTSDRVIDTLVTLPEPDGVTDVQVHLDMRCFGVVADEAQGLSCDPATGLPAALPVGGSDPPLVIGSWPPAQPTPCAGEQPPGTVCVPGGAFLLGTPVYLPVGELDPVPEQLVRVDAFWLDLHETTVGEMRSYVAHVGAPDPNKAGIHDTCTWTAEDTGREGMPVNCISVAMAADVCETRGMRLPREAEWEWAAGNLTRESVHPWLDDGDPCDRAIVARGRFGDPQDLGEQSSCLGPDDIPGPVAGGSPTDRTELGVENLGGNVSEWVADALIPLADAGCWGPSPVLHENPECAAPSDIHANRGGSWNNFAFGSASSWRNGVSATGLSPFVGFRCAR